MQRHLDEPRAADSVLDHSQLTGGRTLKGAPRERGGRRKEVIDGGRKPAERGRWARLKKWRIGEAGSELDVVVGRIETGMVEDIEKLRVVFEMEALRQLEILEDREIETLLEWTAEHITATRSVTCFEIVTNHGGTWVAGRNAIRSGCKRNWRAERQGVQHRFPSVDAGRSLQKRTDALGAKPADGNNGIGNEVLGAPENAAGAPREIDHAIRLAAL